MIRSVAWVIATTLGLVVAGFIFHFPGSFGGLATWDVSAAIVGLLLGAISGVLVGLMQWAALLLPRRPGGRLLLAMAIGIGVTHSLSDGGPNSVGLVGVSILGGLAMLAAFAGPLGERRPVALATCLVAWTGGLLLAELVTKALGMPFEETPVGWATRHAMDGLVVGLVWGIATVAVGLPAALDRRRAGADPVATAAPSIGG
jgi:hypothetical protein